MSGDSGSHVRQRHPTSGGLAVTRDTHGEALLDFDFTPQVTGMSWSDARDGEQVQAPDIGPYAVDGFTHIEPSSIPVSAFEASIRAPVAVSVMPTLPDPAYPEGSLVLFLPDGKLYRNRDDVWDRSLDAEDMTVGQLTGDQIMAGAIGAVHIVTTGLTADVIRGGVLILRPTDDYTQGIRVEDSGGNLLSSWGPTGMKITDPANAARYVLLDAGSLKFTTNDGADGYPTAVTPDGINASVINFGASPGGHNLILNSSFELADFVAGSTVLTYTDFNKWAAAQRFVAPANITDGGAVTKLAMTSAGWA